MSKKRQNVIAEGIVKGEKEKSRFLVFPVAVAFGNDRKKGSSPVHDHFHLMLHQEDGGGGEANCDTSYNRDKDRRRGQRERRMQWSPHEGTGNTRKKRDETKS